MSDAESDVGDVVDDPLVEVVRAVGHENITAEHASTVELTTDDWLTPAGDCIVGVEADRTPRDFSTSFREACQEADATITATFAVGEPGDEAVDVDDPAYVAEIAGRGDPDLTLSTTDRWSAGPATTPTTSEPSSSMATAPQTSTATSSPR